MTVNTRFTIDKLSRRKLCIYCNPANTKITHNIISLDELSHVIKILPCWFYYVVVLVWKVYATCRSNTRHYPTNAEVLRGLLFNQVLCSVNIPPGNDVWEIRILVTPIFLQAKWIEIDGNQYEGKLINILNSCESRIQCPVTKTNKSKIENASWYFTSKFYTSTVWRCVQD